MNPTATFEALDRLRSTLVSVGAFAEPALVVAAVALAAFALIGRLRRWRGWALAIMAMLLIAGELLLVWFHWRLWALTPIMDPASGTVTGRFAVPLWIESEKLYVWALVVAVLGSLMQRQRRELLPGVMLVTAGLVAGAALLGKPFTDPLPGFFAQYVGYLRAVADGRFAVQAFEGMESARQFYYNAWYMWVHPPLLFLSYGAFAISFVATVLMIARRHSSYETTAYRWAMWLLYTAYLHARLYLRREGMWKTVAVLGVLSFVILVLTYVATYVVPGAHSYVAAPSPSLVAEAFAALTGGGS